MCIRDSINTAAIKDESIITQVAEAFGSQCMVLGIEAKKRRDGPGYEANYDNGREHSGKDEMCIRDRCHAHAQPRKRRV